jgi:hypothetical protein
MNGARRERKKGMGEKTISFCIICLNPPTRFSPIHA